MPKQRKEEDLQNIYNYITAYFAERNLPPTQREIAEASFVSRSSVTRYLDILAERGLIIREDGLARGISLPRARPDQEEDTPRKEGDDEKEED